MKFDIYQEVTDRIIKQLEQGIIPWHKPWKVCANIKGAEDLRKVAFNRVTKTAYSILNQMLLSKAGEYASFKQWQDLGGKIKKGAKAEIIVFWKWINYIDTEKSTEEEVVTKSVPFLKYLQVFHIDDVEGVEPLKFKEMQISDSFELIDQAEEIINNYKTRENINIYFGGDSAFYSPSDDSITLPNRFQFNKKTAEYYSTAFHEITHSTGAKHRLDRLSEKAFFGNEEYSKEELVAEIGACGLLTMLNIETKSSFKNSVAYIQAWISKLKQDNKLIISASAKAEKSINYILNGKEEQVA